MSDKKSLQRQMANTKISEQELIGIGKIVFRNQHITANPIKKRQIYGFLVERFKNI